MLAFAFQFLLQASNVPEERGFPWTIHAITIPATLLVGLVIGWALHARKVAEDKAREEIEGKG